VRDQGVSPEHGRMIRKLEAIASLTAEDKAALAALPLRLRTVEDHVDLVREGDRPPECCLIVEGFFCRYKVVGDGQRQIFSFHIPGDVPDLQSLHLKVMDHNLASLTPGRVGYIPHAAMQELLATHPNVATAFWRDTLIDSAVFREWLASTGRRSAHQRIAHILCEVYVRLQSVGLAGDDGFHLPVTQAELGDSLGLSAVHVNRVLQDLRRDGLIESRGKFVAVADWPRLQQAGDFDRAYLHMLADEAA
jgi:CRP-like cAMP-binding protein